MSVQDERGYWKDQDRMNGKLIHESGPAKSTDCWEDRAESFTKGWGSCYGPEMGPFTPKERPRPISANLADPVAYFQIPQQTLSLMIDALALGLEYAQEALIRHDSTLGRTISRNKREAEYIEEDISKIKKSIEEFKR